MDGPEKVTVRRVEPPGEAGTCAYCGARLVGGYYFCLACATPYKPVEAVLPVPRPRPLTEGELIRRKAPHVWPVFWTFAAVLLAIAVMSQVVLPNARPDLRMLLGTGAVFLTTCVVAALHWPSLAVQLRRVGFGHSAALVGLAALVPLLAVNYAYHRWLIESLGAKDASPIRQLRAAGVTEAELVLVFCLLPAAVEEVAFRGLVQHWLQAALAPVRALALASFLFTVLHGSVVSAPYLFGLGMLLGWAKWKTGSLYPSMLIHFLHNLVVVEFF